MSVKHCKAGNEFHIPLPGGDKGMGHLPEGLSLLPSIKKVHY